MERIAFVDELRTQSAKDLHLKAYEIWVKQLCTSQMEYPEHMCRADVDYSICQFINYNKRRHIGSPENDITYWFDKEYKGFQNYIFLLDEANERRQLEKGVKTDIDIVFENDVLLVIKPNTHQSAMKYGKNTKWCVTYSHSMTAFDRYTRNGYRFYYFLPKGQHDGKIVIYVLNNNIDHSTDQEDNYLCDEEDNNDSCPHHYIQKLLPVTTKEWVQILELMKINFS
jgi:hypothetical protein